MLNVIRRFISAVLLTIFIISGCMTGTLCWQNLNQSALNEAWGMQEEFAAELIKYEKLPDGTPTDRLLPNAEFYLFTAEGKQIGGRFLTDENGKISVKLPAGNYYFQESTPPFGFDFDTENGVKKTKYPFTVTGDETKTETVTAYNIRKLGPLSIEKRVQNADGSELTDEQKEFEFVFTVTFSDGGTYAYSIDVGKPISFKSGETLKLKHGQTAVFLGIPTGVTYNVVEHPIPEYAISSNRHTGTITPDGAHAVFVNTFTPELLGSLTVTKEVKGENADLNKEFEITVIIDGQTHTFVLKHGESKTFPNLPIGTEYTVTEKDYTANGYIASVESYTGKITNNSDVRLPFVNVYHAELLPGSLTVEKEVIGENADKEKEFSFTVTFSDGGTYSYSIDGGKPIELESGGTLVLKHGQKAVFTNLPDGVTYVVKETDSSDYLPDFTEQSGTIVGGQNVTAHFINRVPAKPALIRVTKVLEGNYADQDKEFHFTLTVDGVKIDFVLKPGQSQEFEVPAGSIYEVIESLYPEFIQNIENGFGIVLPGQTVEVVATNTYIQKDEDIQGEKTWDLKGFGLEVLPNSIIVRLLKDGLLVEEKIVTPDENGKWTYNFTAPKYDADGNEIKYTIEEAPLESFIPSYDGWNIKNTYLPSVSVVLPDIQKQVIGENPPDTTFTFVLSGKDGAPMPEGSENGSKIVTIDGSGEIPLGNIQFTKPGVYIYTITELLNGTNGWTYDASVYTITVTVTLTDGKLQADYILEKDNAPAEQIIFVNRYEKPVVVDKTVEISGQKIWNHGNNPEALRPKSIIVYLYADGVLIEQKLVTAADDWKYSFVLPKYAEDGHEIVYTISEAPIPDYEVSVDGYNLVNTYIPHDPPIPENPDLPPTGGTTLINLWLVLMLSSLTGLVVVLLSKQRRTKDPDA